MKHLITFSLAVLLSVPVVASARTAPKFRKGSEASVKPLAAEPGRLARSLERFRAHANGGGVEANVIISARSSDVIVFPAAGNVKGAGGEFFRSDVTLISFDETEHQHLAVFWLQNGVETTSPPAVEVTLEPNTYYNFEDFVGVTLQRTNQLGTIVIFPINEDGSDDFESAIDGFSRIWTNQPNSNGTVAQPFEPADPYTFDAYPTASVMGLRHDASYRSNFGLVNIDDEPHTFTVRFLGEGASNEQTITVPAQGMVHRAVPAGNYGHLVIEVDVDNVEAPWLTYGTSNDNITGDGWVSLGSMILTPEDLASSK
jgi:hypothetical protein